MTSITSILQQVDIFRSLDQMQLEQIAEITIEEHFKSGQVICEQGDHADKMYIIRSGQVEVAVNHNNVNQEALVYLGEGQVIGEMSLVDDGPRSASVTAADDDTSVFSIPNAIFKQLCATNTEIGYIIMRNIAQDMSFKLRHRDYQRPQSDEAEATRNDLQS